MANNAGEYTIPGASIVADGDQMVSNSVRIKVLPQDQGDSNSSSSSSTHSSSGTGVSNQDLFITASASKTNVYEQEAFVLTYKIYTRESNLQLNNAKLPDFKGFHSQEIEMTTNARWTPEHYQGRNYYTTVYRGELALLNGKSREKNNPKGWIINAHHLPIKHLYIIASPPLKNIVSIFLPRFPNRRFAASCDRTV